MRMSEILDAFRQLELENPPKPEEHHLFPPEPMISVDESGPQKPIKTKSAAIKPLTPEQSRTKADKVNAATNKLSDMRAKANIDQAAQQRKIASIRK